MSIQSTGPKGIAPLPAQASAAPSGDAATDGAEGVARTIHQALTTASGTEEERNIALAKSVGARDYDTARTGSTVRNVMRMGEALQANVLRLPGPDSFAPSRSAFSESGLMELMAGRDHLTIIHGEGPQARVSVIVNQSQNKNVPTALAILREGAGLEVLMEHDLAKLFASPNDRLVLGPLNHHATYATSPLHHEVQSGHNCALHAINAMAGEQIVSKSGFDQTLIEQRLNQAGSEGVTENDFYRNTPLRQDLVHFFDFDQGIAADVLTDLAAKCLSGEVKRFIPAPLAASHSGARQASLLDFAEHAELHARGLLLLHKDHVIAFRRAPDADSGAWHLIDSSHDTPRAITPSQYLQQIMDQGHCELIAWQPARSFAMTPGQRLH